jgi:hypothetical protein
MFATVNSKRLLFTVAHHRNKILFLLLEKEHLDCMPSISLLFRLALSLPTLPTNGDNIEQNGCRSFVLKVRRLKTVGLEARHEY